MAPFDVPFVCLLVLTPFDVSFVCLFVSLAPFDVSPLFGFLAPLDAGLENVMFTFTFPALISGQCTMCVQFVYDVVLFGTMWQYYIVVLFGKIWYFLVGCGNS